MSLTSLQQINTDVINSQITSITSPSSTLAQSQTITTKGTNETNSEFTYIQSLVNTIATPIIYGGSGSTTSISDSLNSLQTAIQTYLYDRLALLSANVNLINAQNSVSTLQVAFNSAQSQKSNAQTAVINAQTALTTAQTTVNSTQTATTSALTDYNTKYPPLPRPLDYVPSNYDWFWDQYSFITCNNITNGYGGIPRGCDGQAYLDIWRTIPNPNYNQSTPQCIDARSVNSVCLSLTTAQTTLTTAQTTLTTAQTALTTANTTFTTAETNLTIAQTRLTTIQSTFNTAQSKFNTDFQAMNTAYQTYITTYTQYAINNKDTGLPSQYEIEQLIQSNNLTHITHEIQYVNNIPSASLDISNSSQLYISQHVTYVKVLINQIVTAKATADAQAKALADAQAKALADAQAKALADAQAKALADAQTKALADAQVKALADAQAKALADAQAKALADAQAKALADAQVKQPVETGQTTLYIIIISVLAISIIAYFVFFNSKTNFNTVGGGHSKLYNFINKFI